jgi:hypothetical protein
MMYKPSRRSLTLAFESLVDAERKCIPRDGGSEESDEMEEDDAGGGGDDGDRSLVLTIRDSTQVMCA